MGDTGTTYSERCIAPSRSADHMKSMINIMWLCRHGGPKRFAAGPEFSMKFMKILLFGLNHFVVERASRSLHKNGILKINNDEF